MSTPPPFGIAKRLYAVSFLLIVALAGLAGQTWLQLGVVADLARKTGEVRVQQLARVAEIELNVTQVSLQIRHAMLVKTPADLASTLAYIGDKRQHMDASFNTYSGLVQSPAGRAGVEQLSQLLKNFWQIGGANIALIQASQKDEAFQFLVDKTIPTRNLLLAGLNAEKVRQSALLTAELDQIQGNALSTRNWLVGMAIAVALGLLAFAWHISSVLQRRVALSQQVVERVRNGDLTQPVHDAANDEFSPLLRSMDGMQQALTDMVRGVRTGAESVSSASAEIAQGNQDLSNRTESQASALEQTAASMEQLNSTVQQNADNAAQANQLAMLSSSVAIEGGEVVSKVVQTMKGINESSQKIADIIGVIDSIAFQTNILALNAAVEAARAGEQGRGFAVVASEVRSLAGRSAEAAKEIKTLISASVERVAQGTQLVDQAGATMTEVVGSIRRVTDIMGEISAASAEQSKGVAQVGEAVTQMDHSTQQNAALVEQMAAAANSLRHQAQELVDVASVFRLAGGSSAVARL